MASSFSTNKHIEEPASGDYNNAWAAPINLNWTAIDTAFGGHSNIDITGVLAGTYALTLDQYRPPNLIFSGPLTADLVYVLPTGVGGLWTVFNNTTGAHVLTFGVSGGGTFILPQGKRSLLVSDGTNVSSAHDLVVAFNQIAGTLANGQLVSGNVTQFQALLAIAMSQVSGALPVAQLPATAYRGTLGSGKVTVQSGGAPSGGASGDIFLIY